MADKITRADVEALLFGYIELKSEVQHDGVERWAFDLSPMGVQTSMLDHSMSWYERHAEHEFDQYKFSSRDAAMRYAFGWLRRNIPLVEKGAVQQLKDGGSYRKNLSVTY